MPRAAICRGATTPRSASCRGSHDAAPPTDPAVLRAPCRRPRLPRRPARRRRDGRRHPHPARQWHDHPGAREPGGARRRDVPHGEDGHALGDARDGGHLELPPDHDGAGHEKLDGTQIVEAADRMGGSIEAYGDADFSEIAATALDRYWAEMLDLVAEVALTPSLPDGTLKAVRDFLVRQIRNRGEKPYDVALDTLLARTFGDNPYAWEPSGLKESLERVDRAALIAHYRRHYVPGGMVLAVSGKVKAADVSPGPSASSARCPRRRCRPPIPRALRRPRPRATP